MMGREGGEGEWRGEGRRGKGRRGKGRAPHDPLAWGPQCLNPALTRSYILKTHTDDKISHI